MQQIERYGIIALLFLVVSIVVVALWDPEPGGAADQGPGGQVAAAAKSAPAAGQAAAKQPAQQSARPSSKARTQDSRRSAAFRDRGAAPAVGAANRSTYQASAPLDLGGEQPKRQRGYTSRAQESTPDRSVRAMPVAKEPLPPAHTASTLTREPTRTPRGSKTASSAGAKQASKPKASLAAKPRTSLASKPMVASTTQRRTPAKPAVTKQPQSTGASYVVRAGDSLERIARRQLGDGSRWREVARLNGIDNPNLVRIGAKLKLPGAGAAPLREQAPTAVAKAAPSKSQASSKGGDYVVAKGDVLSRIAERELGSSKRWREIVDLNPGLDPNKLYVGKRIKLPTRSEVLRKAAPRAQESKLAKVADTPRGKPQYVVQ